jgi:hypothetical protein
VEQVGLSLDFIRDLDQRVGEGLHGHRINFDIVNITEAELWARHPQLAAIDAIPRANENVSLVF